MKPLDPVLLKYWTICLLEIRDELSGSSRITIERIHAKLADDGTLSAAEEDLLELLYEDYC